MKPIKHSRDGTIIKEENTDNIMRVIIKGMLKERHMTMAELVRQYNILHPDTPTTPQNLSNKLSRDSLRFREFLDLIELCGYSISFSPIEANIGGNRTSPYMTTAQAVALSYLEEQDSEESVGEKTTIDPKVNLTANEKSAKKASFADLAALGYAVVDSPNFGSIVIAGELADNAAEFIKNNLDEETTEIQEVILCNAANREYKVMAKPVDSATRKYFVL